METPTPLQTLFIYSKIDETIKNEFAHYLKPFRDKRLLSHPDFRVAEEFPSLRLKSLIPQKDVIIILIRMEIFSTALFSHDLASVLVKEHLLGRLLLIPVRIQPTPYQEYPFKKINSYPVNGEPVCGPYWHNRYYAYGHIFNALEPILPETLQKKQELEEVWQATTKENSIISYGDFLTKYPHSKYAKKAKETSREMEEIRLWEIARKKGDVKSYLHYLTFAPYKRKLYEAADKIYAIEHDEALTWKEVEKTKHLELAFHYKNSFFSAPNLGSVEQMIQQSIHNYNEINKIDKNQVNTIYLDAVIYEKLENHEIFANITYQDLILNLRWRLQYLVKTLKKRLHRPSFWLTVLVIINFFTIDFFYSSEFFLELHKIQQFLMLLAFITMDVYFFYKIIYWFRFIFSDINFTNSAIIDLSRLSVLLKTALINREQNPIKKILKTLNIIETKAYQIEIKTPKIYWNQEKDLNRMELDKSLMVLSNWDT